MIILTTTCRCQYRRKHSKESGDDGTAVGTPHETEKPPLEKTDWVYVSDTPPLLLCPAHHFRIAIFDPTQIEFEKNDPRDPYNTSPARKWLMTFVACAFAAFTGMHHYSATNASKHLLTAE
jgi:hypothetical protein